MSLVAAGIILAATPWGLELTPDSPRYLSFSRNLLQGYGFGLLAPDGGVEQVTQYPPLYSMFLAMAARASGTEVLAAARWVEALLFAATIVLISFAAAKYARSALIAPILASLLIMTGGSVPSLFGSVMSEGLFIFSGALGLILLAAYLERGWRWILLASAAVTALALLTRYAGLVLVATGVAVLLLNGGGGRRIWRAGIFGLVSVMPLAVWLLSQEVSAPTSAISAPPNHALVVAGNGPVVASRELGFHPITLNQLAYGPLNVARWVIPDGILREVASVVSPAWSSGAAATKAGLVVLALVCLLAGLLGVKALLLGLSWHPTRPGSATQVLLTFCVLYPGFLLLTMSIANPSTQLDLRTLSPLYVSVVVAGTGLLLTWWRSLDGRRMQQLALAILVGLVVAGDLGQTLLWVREGQSNGLGYASRAWQMSPLLDRALALPPDKQIFTNGIDIIASYAGRPAFGLPQKAGNPDVYVARLAVAERHLRQRDAVLVYFDTLDPYPPLSPYPSVQEVSQSVPLRLIDREADGAIYAAE